MSDLIPYVTAHWAELAGVVALFVIVGERVAAITETKKDDAIFGVIHKALSAVGLRFPDVK